MIRNFFKELLVDPYPHAFVDDFLDKDYAKKIQKEILQLDPGLFDRYDNPFEQKLTLRDKHAFPPCLSLLMKELTSTDFLSRLSEYTGHTLINDQERLYWGVHVYSPGDKLDVHVDAGFHPINGRKKQVTLGIYFSKDWSPDYGAGLEIWNGDDAGLIPNAKIYQVKNTIMPLFNRAIVFTCTDNSWHGISACKSDTPSDARRIFVTISYLSDEHAYSNKLKKAYFVARPLDEPNPDKDALRLIRANHLLCSTVYNISGEIKN